MFYAGNASRITIIIIYGIHYIHILFVSVQVYGNVRQYALFYLHNNHMALLSFWLSIVLTHTVHNIHMYCYSTHGI